MRRRDKDKRLDDIEDALTPDGPKDVLAEADFGELQFELMKLSYGGGHSYPVEVSEQDIREELERRPNPWDVGK